jgi:hypothetical protein
VEQPDGIVEVKVPYAISGDTLTVIYSSKNPTHCVRTQAIVVTAEDEIRIRAKEIHIRAVDVIFDRLLAGCSEEEFMSLRCPVCGGGLHLNLHFRLHSFSVRCSGSVTHLFRHGTIKEAPAWWHSRVLGGWMDDPVSHHDA